MSSKSTKNLPQVIEKACKLLNTCEAVVDGKKIVIEPEIAIENRSGTITDQLKELDNACKNLTPEFRDNIKEMYFTKSIRVIDEGLSLSHVVFK